MSTKESKKEKAREVIDILQEISVLLVRGSESSAYIKLIPSRTLNSTGHSCLYASHSWRTVSIQKP